MGIFCENYVYALQRVISLYTTPIEIGHRSSEVYSPLFRHVRQMSLNEKSNLRMTRR